ncbi:MAG TPA: hypothetical protein VER08_04505 [Pyrinomonadaceae bacterium]|nr:hypothetical protein [Pyrinomonadaceae bacterium]
MRNTLLKTSCVVLSLLLACAASHAGQAEKGRIEVRDGFLAISFVPPPGVGPAPREELELLQKMGRRVKFMFRDAEADMTVSVNTFGEDATAEEVAGIVKAMEAELKKRHPQGVFLARGPVKINGYKWLRLRHRTGPAADEEVNDYYLIDWAGKVVLFNFSTMVGGYERRRAALERSARTIQLMVMVEAPVEEGPREQPPPARRP